MLETTGRLDTTAAPDVAPAPFPAPRWNTATRIVFRLCFLYFSLYVVTTQMLGGLWIVPKLPPPDMGATGWMRRPVEWTAAHVFHAASQYSRVNTGSGDKTIDWVHAFILLVLSLAATAIWSIADRRRPHYRGLHAWFHLFLRFAAATTMVGYGIVRQFPCRCRRPASHGCSSRSVTSHRWACCGTRSALRFRTSASPGRWN